MRSGPDAGRNHIAENRVKLVERPRLPLTSHLLPQNPHESPAHRLPLTAHRLMITGAHTICYSHNADQLRAFLRDVLKLPSVDAGRGWLIFASPPAELAVHPAEEEAGSELYLMCDDLEGTLRELAAHGVTVAATVSEQRWGIVTRIRLPSGDEFGLYQPKHPLATHLR